MPTEKTLDYIKPKFTGDEQIVKAFFTLKNADRFNENGKIPGLNLGFSTREDRSQIDKNRSFLFDELGMNTKWIARGSQVHSNRVRYVIHGGLFDRTDGLITNIPGLTLAIQVADCAAVLLADKKNKVIGAVHAGWRGAAGRILPNTIHLMKKHGADQENMEAFISPCISLKHFEVGEEVASQFPDEFVDRTSFEKPHVDLKAFLKNEMTERGIPESQIEVDPGCTYGDEEHFYSYRREDDQSGRMFGLIQLNY